MATMKLIVFNVERGQCVYIRTPADFGTLIDCGRSESGEIASPVEWLVENEAESLVDVGGHAFASMVVTHPHPGHVAELAKVMERLSPAVLIRDGDDDWQSGSAPEQLDVDMGVSLRVFSLSREEAEALGGDADDVCNNRSIVTVVKYDSPEGYTWKVVVAGDNLARGWEALLGRPEFCEAVSGADFFVASAHGEERGFSSELFRVMGKPIANIVSARGDAAVDDRYRKNGQGVKFPDGKRTHFVTREDGNITVAMHDDGRFDAWLFSP